MIEWPGSGFSSSLHWYANWATRLLLSRRVKSIDVIRDLLLWMEKTRTNNKKVHRLNEGWWVFSPASFFGGWRAEREQVFAAGGHLSISKTALVEIYERIPEAPFVRLRKRGPASVHWFDSMCVCVRGAERASLWRTFEPTYVICLRTDRPQKVDRTNEGHWGPHRRRRRHKDLEVYICTYARRVDISTCALHSLSLSSALQGWGTFGRKRNQPCNFTQLSAFLFPFLFPAKKICTAIQPYLEITTI